MTTEIISEYGDITKMQVDGIVNSANPTLMKGSGLCRVIYEQAGEQELAAYLQNQPRLGVGQVIVTPGFNLPAKYIIHTVTPKYYLQNDKKEQQLASCYAAILKAAACYEMKTIAIPWLGTGHHYWPRAEVQRLAQDTIEWFLNSYETSLEKIIQVEYIGEAQRKTSGSLLQGGRGSVFKKQLVLLHR